MVKLKGNLDNLLLLTRSRSDTTYHHQQAAQ
jgi:hypothetical protein